MKASFMLVILCVSQTARAEADGGEAAGAPHPSGGGASASGILSEQKYGPEHNEHGSGGEFWEHERGCSPRRHCDENEGVCRRSCNGHVENEVHDGCGGHGCKCCTRKGNKKHCTSNVECREHGGRCTQAKCKHHEVHIRRGCKGQGCNCCAPHVRVAEGIVNEDTQEGEEVVEEGVEENESDDGEEEDEEE